ncbi:zinc finger protein-domain-containing protein [Aspergillus avenaceus]|uniref:Zinc finger protein-domain-containing protein n=1 Tax=Aspergillus avenaceus TaxID=36643 RepID=A0A5N6U521_ASPAV|nr:zinc finger protein-domain-containing protein [Aspergillus avenaceus]
MASKQDYHHVYTRIGSGFCGTVWAKGIEDLAIKREDGGPSRSLTNDFTMHKRALDAFLKLSCIERRDRDELLQTQVRIPQCYSFLTPHDTWWKKNLASFPPGYSSCNAICSERIPPFPENTRTLLVERYCPAEIRDQILSSASNRACLIRPYIGRKRTYGTGTNARSRFRGFSLQNYPLHLDQMVELGIPSDHIDHYAAMMGEALATLHWLGEIDGNDIEFVLAPLPTPDDGNTAAMTNVLGRHTLWMLDFDLCRSMTMDLEGVEQAITAFRRNDPFYPRPNTHQWVAFRRQYLQTSMTLGFSFNTEEAESRLDLARKFIDLLETNK